MVRKNISLAEICNIQMFLKNLKIKKTTSASVGMLRICRWYTNHFEDAHGITQRKEDLVPEGTFLY